MQNNNEAGFTFDMKKGESSIIKVIGVGGAGNNALKYMYEKGIYGVDFVICNTDAQALDNNPVEHKIQLGVSTTEGLGAGADPEVGEKSAIESMEDIKSAFGQNTKMVFITAGMGGGTGTGAAPVVAKVAKEMGILTVAIVTVPFTFEGKRRLDQAENGLAKLRENVDSLIVINNDKLRQQYGNLSFSQAFAKADEVLTNAAKGMAEVITAPFAVNIDFRDAKSVLQNSGTALMSIGVASGENRAEEAVKKALDSPLLNNNKITGAKDVLLLIVSGTDEKAEATMDEIGIINDYIQTESGDTANIIFGAGTDAELGDAIKVLVIATGFSKEDKKIITQPERITISLDEKTPARPVSESPFKTRAERGLEPKTETSPFVGRKVINLDDDISLSSSSNVENSTNTISQFVEQIAETQTLSWGEEEDDDLQFQTEIMQEEENNTNLFSFQDEEENDFFSFGIEQKTEPTKIWEEEQPIEFSFTINEPKENEPIINEVAEPVVEEKPQVQQVQEVVEVQEEFTFISKTTGREGVNERRNKLKEFTANRYQAYDEINEFENIPAFKRKNIVLENQVASEQNIN
ncbi:MAG: cell division protein FtsZ, partial [Bergeyella zoohelcum]|nr:cell division protein FtsZ [Bergeyella zoohelcum]